MMDIPPLVVVLWRDATGRDGWNSLADAKEHKPMPAITAGFLITDDKEKVTLVSGMTMDKDQHDCMDIVTIPKGIVYQMYHTTIHTKQCRKRARKHKSPARTPKS